MNILWDTGAISLFFANHDQAVKYMDQIRNSQSVGFVPRAILAEFYYKTAEKLGKDIAQLRVVSIRSSLIKEEVLTEDDIFTIGSIKLQNKNLSFVDCIIAATAMKKKGTILTTESGFKDIKGLKSIKFEY